ncbi:MAG: hypothetical protein ACE5KV_08675 [Thermoplasmata archaeon]
MRKSTGFALLSIFLVAVLLRFLPLSRYLYWGADFGEYFFLTRELIVNGHISLTYRGWGFTYPYFPGIVFLNAILGLTGASLPASVALVSTFLASLSVFPIFLLGRNLYHEDSAGLIAAGIAAVAFPAVYTTSHAVPGSVGDLLFASCLLLFVKAHSNVKVYYLLYPISMGLVITHHLSTYFLIIALIAAVFFREIISRKSDSRSLGLSIIFLSFLTFLSFLYWVTYAIPFRDAILSKVQGSWWGVVLSFLLAMTILFVLVKIRRRMKWRYRPRYPDLKSRLRFLAFGFLLTYLIMVIVVFLAVPGTTIQLDISAFYFFTPLMMVFAFAFAGGRFSEFSQRGFDPSSWFLALSLSLLFGAAFASDVIVPYRHLQYMIPSLALIGGLGISRISGLLGATGKRGRIFAATMIVALMISMAATSYPPRTILAGHQEGIEARLVSAAHFSEVHVQGLVASDHRVSTILFGFGKANATWDTAPDSLLANSFAEALPEMEEVDTPSGRKRVDFVLIDSDLEKGAMLHPWDPAPALSENALEKFEERPYMKFFDNGYTRLYYVNWGLA